MKPQPAKCDHEDIQEHPQCEYCWWCLTHDVDDETGQVTNLWEEQT